MGDSRAFVSGAEWLLKTLVDNGIEVCFANPGTTELPFVSALERVNSVRPVLGLFEGVCSGAADGYFRISGKPAAVLTHLGPGFANSIANLHNAKRANSGVLNIIGDHVTWHLKSDPPLNSNIQALASAVSTKVYYAGTLETLIKSTEEALEGVFSSKPTIETVVFPEDVQSAQINGETLKRKKRQNSSSYDHNNLKLLFSSIENGEKVLILLGSNALREPSLNEVLRFVDLKNVDFIGETFAATSEHGGGLPKIRRFPYPPGVAHDLLLSYDKVALFGAKHPVAFFASRGIPSFLGDQDRILTIAEPLENSLDALKTLATMLELPEAKLIEWEKLPITQKTEKLTPENAVQIIAAYLPENAIVSSEGGTLGFPFNQIEHLAARHTTLVLTGGAIGQGLPCALGAAIAAPERKTIALQSDGSALFTAQALWSMAREAVDVIIIIAANKKYQVLENEMKRTGQFSSTKVVQDLLTLSDPEIDWVSYSKGLGVPAEKVETTRELQTAFLKALQVKGPHLIEAIIS